MSTEYISDQTESEINAARGAACGQTYSLLTVKTSILNVARMRELHGENEDLSFGRRTRRVRRGILLTVIACPTCGRKSAFVSCVLPSQHYAATGADQ